jgi:hypothetical protein
VRPAIKPISTGEVLRKVAEPRPPQKAEPLKVPRTQLEIIRDVMLNAATRDTWLTLAEIEKLTNFAQPSISAQLRNMRKMGHELQKRRRAGVFQKGVKPAGIWEYRLERRT